MNRLPLFPLPLVLYPEGRLPLRIFEPRYLDMVRDCMRQGSPFGIVAVLPDPADSAAPGVVAALGTTAQIVDFDLLDDGMLGIQCVGGARFRVLEQSRQPDGLWIGQVEYLPVPARAEIAPDFGLLARIVAHIGELPEQPFGAVTADRYDDAAWVAYRLAEVLPLELHERQHLLDLESATERLQWLLESLQRLQASD
ncbi:MAG: LON peptidase substrate-binding domain-containing protein [Xanthomonadales bacterium]|jgi:hypothetical protein|nr:LON peptidase substrate-binding domain-containing protein [Xanthomonadales bacterium]